MDLLDTRRPRALLIAFCLLLWLPGLFTLPPTDRDESRFAQATKQMIETGDYVRIMNGDEPRNRKPIGIHWLQVPFAMAARAAGVATENPIWPYRVPSVLGGLVAVLAVQAFGQRLVGRRAALLAAGMLAASMILVAETHLAKTDAALLGATTLCMGLLAQAYLATGALRWWRAAVFWLALGAGVLLKGPITPMVVGVTAATLALWDGRAGWLRRLRPGWGVPLLVLMVVPWFAAIGIATHGMFFADAVGGDLGRKLASGDDAHGGPPGLHLLLLPLLAFPSSFAALWGTPAAWRGRSDPAMRFLLAWIVPCWVVFEIVPTKLPHYTLPLYPALFLLGAHALLGFPSAVRGWRRNLAWVAPGVAGAVLAGGALALPLSIDAPAWPGVPVAAAVCIVVWLAAKVDRPAIGLAAAPLCTLALLGWELPHATPLWIAPQVERALVLAGRSGTSLGAVGFHEPSLTFLAGTATALLATGQSGAQALASGEVATLAVSRRDEAAFDAEAARLGMAPRAFAIVSGFNYSRGYRTALTLYVR
jgi:4-amino-4-deoxy-L-arabinose transferase-like glycosyltransferase